MIKLCRLLSVFAAIIVVATSISVAAQVSIIDKMRTKIKSLKSFRATVSIWTSLDPVGGGKGTTMSATEKIVYQAPNKSSVIVSGVMGNLFTVSNGAKLFRYSDLSKEYSVQPAPASLAESLITGFNKASLVASGNSTVKGERVSIYSGTIATARGNAKLTLCLGAADNLPRKAIIVIPSLPNPRGGAYRVTTTELFTNMSIDKPVDPKAFVFTPPPGSTLTQRESDVPGLGTSGLPGMP